MATQQKMIKWRGKIFITKKCSNCGGKKPIVASDVFGRCCDCKRRLEKGESLNSAYVALKGKGTDLYRPMRRASREKREERDRIQKESLSRFLKRMDKNRGARFRVIKGSTERRKLRYILALKELLSMIVRQKGA